MQTVVEIRKHWPVAASTRAPRFAIHAHKTYKYANMYWTVINDNTTTFSRESRPVASVLYLHSTSPLLCRVPWAVSRRSRFRCCRCWVQWEGARVVHAYTRIIQLILLILQWWARRYDESVVQLALLVQLLLFTEYSSDYCDSRIIVRKALPDHDRWTCNQCSRSTQSEVIRSS